MRISGKGGYSMLKQWIPAAKPDKEELDKRLDAAQEELLRLQMQIKEHKLPVLVLIEGWGAAGKGSTIGGIIKNIDPRFFKVASMSAPTEEEKRKPFLYRYFVKIPEAGKFEFLDSGWMDEVTKGRLRGELSDKQYAERIESIKRFERQLTDNGYLVLKLFFQIGKRNRKSVWRSWKPAKIPHGVWARTTGGRTSIMTNVRKSTTNTSQIRTLP